MTKVLSEDAVIHRVSQIAVNRIVAAVVAELDEMHDCLSGDDSGLQTVWEEICVQVQHEQSAFWNTYDELVRDIVERQLLNLEDYEKSAIWFQTDEGVAWVCSEPADQNQHVSIDEDVVTHIAAALYAFADGFKRDSISEYLERTYEEG